MNKQPTDKIETQFDSLKWTAIVLLLAAGVVANIYFGAEPLALRAIAWLALLGVVFTMAALTAQGKMALHFFYESQVEMRKVVWPTKQETVQTTLIVIAMVLIAGLVLWSLDNFFLWAVGKITTLK